MKSELRGYLLQECKKLISRHHIKVEQGRRDRARFRKRTGLQPQEPEHSEPKYWSLSPHFNPFKVRKRAEVLSHTIAAKVRAEKYEPQPALVVAIPKPHGGPRYISIFPIPDAAVSAYLFRRLLKRNQHLLSSYAYAYRPDRLPHHAIDNLYKYAANHPRLYLLEYDFASYFDCLNHQYILGVLTKYFRISPRERKLVGQFLKMRRAVGTANYNKGVFDVGTAGTPQGASISLFIANATCFELDQQLEREGAIFARYADDLVVLCDDYAKAHRCANRILEHEKQSNASVNLVKSPGISLFTIERLPEMKFKSSFEFLGYKIMRTAAKRDGHQILGVGLSVGDKAVARIKKKLSSILFRHLLLYPKAGKFSANRITQAGVDWDMVTCINELRHYIYGNVSEQHLKTCLNDKSAKLRFTKSVLAYFPLVDDPSVFRSLDGWLLQAIQATQRQRAKIIAQWCPSYRTYSQNELLTGSWYVETLPNEAILPSFFKSWLYVRKLLHLYDLARFPALEYAY